jgi:hypothetical protein
MTCPDCKVITLHWDHYQVQLCPKHAGVDELLEKIAELKYRLQSWQDIDAEKYLVNWKQLAQEAAEALESAAARLDDGSAESDDPDSLGGDRGQDQSSSGG